MKPKYLQPENSHRDRWMVSYLDVLTIMLIFFVAAAAKTAENVEKVAKKPPETRLAAISGTQTKLEQRGLDVHREARGLVISLPQAVLFGSGDDRISEAALPTVAQVAEVLRGVPNRVILIGHADSTPIHNRRFKSNWELSAARGLRLLELLSSRYGIDETRLSVSSDGSNQPRSPNDTPDGRANNRRAEIVILD